MNDDENQQQGHGEDQGEQQSQDQAEQQSRRVSAVDAVKKALDQFSTLTGRAPESVVGVRWHEDRWKVRLEVVESRRVPDSADLLAEYEVDLDGGGDLLSYDRKDRYVRGRPSD
ncbi:MULTISPECIES: gas vesicle protein [unclassified Brachybacterium]|uniref:gas vesicle protein GvpO n=1 Tax=unclassified Brachybacterium TaxID=2623841 RepID=UPI003615B0FB